MQHNDAIIHVQRAQAKELAAFDLNSEEWSRAQPARIERYWSGAKAPVARQAEARLLWHTGGLCVRFVGGQHEALVTNAQPQTKCKTIGLWERDVCEVFVAPDAENPTSYFEFEAAPTGEWLDLALQVTPRGRETNWDYQSGMSAHACVGNNEVTIGIFVPWSAFDCQSPKVGERWRGNLFRCVGAGANRGYLAWQPTRTAEPNFHMPQAFGWLEFR